MSKITGKQLKCLIQDYAQGVTPDVWEKIVSRTESRSGDVIILPPRKKVPSYLKAAKIAASFILIFALGMFASDLLSQYNISLTGEHKQVDTAVTARSAAAPENETAVQGKTTADTGVQMKSPVIQEEAGAEEKEESYTSLPDESLEEASYYGVAQAQTEEAAADEAVNDGVLTGGAPAAGTGVTVTKERDMENDPYLISDQVLSNAQQAVPEIGFTSLYLPSGMAASDFVQTDNGFILEFQDTWETGRIFTVYGEKSQTDLSGLDANFDGNEILFTAAQEQDSEISLHCTIEGLDLIVEAYDIYRDEVISFIVSFAQQM